MQEEGFDTNIEEQVELLTIRNYDATTIERYASSSRNLIEQKTASTVRIVRSKE